MLLEGETLNALQMDQYFKWNGADLEALYKVNNPPLLTLFFHIHQFYPPL